MNFNKPVLELNGIGKNFSGVSVLRDIELKIFKGEVRAVLGSNGAGKSTLMKIIGGVHKPDAGDIFIDSYKVNLESPSDAQKKGISVIYQELSLIPTLDVISNIFLGRETSKGLGFIDKKKMLLKYEEICTELNFCISPYIKVSKLSIAQQQMIEIMKAISCNSEIIIMDEPTTSLTEKEKNNLFNIILKLKEKGKTILYISHMLDEIFKISDRITILKDGNLEGTFDINELNKDKVISIMTGKKNLKSIMNKSNLKIYQNKNIILEVKNITVNQILSNINFKLYKGEILGIAGLVGSGRTELCETIFGMRSAETGEIFLENEKVSIHSPRSAIKNGIGLVPEDRKHLGLIQKQEVYKNSTIIQLKKMMKGILLNKQKEYKFINNAVSKLDIKLNNVFTKVKNLSGGNQQKVVVSKWINMDLKILIFDEPTKGIDIAAKEDIFKIMIDFANKGVGIIFISSDLEEVARLSNRVLVMKEGKILSELIGEKLNIENITYAALNG